MQAIGESTEGLEWAVFMGKECKRGKSSQSPSSKFIGLRMARGFWRMFIGQEINVGLL